MKSLEIFTEKNKKSQKLKEVLRKYKSVLVAFSGGADSGFLLKAAMDFLGKEKVLAVTVKSELIPGRKILEAKGMAERIGCKWEVLDFSLLSEDNLKRNPINRCYLCKKIIFKNLKKIAKKRGLKEVIEGTNVEDIKGYRPGLKAIKELNVKSPLLEVGFTKEEIRLLSRKLGLSSWNRPSFSCLATRFPYGERLTKKKLKKVEEAENLLIAKGFNQVRVRDYGKIARIEVLEKDFDKIFSQRESIISSFKRIGYQYVTLDLEGYRSGSMDIEFK
ncbi:MAG: ATP-dependent sacrificial sulfur transferase LarE [candidate division WOR-3 bacterium]